MRAKITLNMIVCLFSQYWQEKFTVEPVEVIYHNRSEIYPDLSTHQFELTSDYVANNIGINLSNEKIC